MKKTPSRIIFGLGLLATGMFLMACWGLNKVTLPAVKLSGIWKAVEDELAVGEAFTVRDEKGELVTMLSRRVRRGDEIITAEGKHYRVRKVSGNEAVARLLGLDGKFLGYCEYYSQIKAYAAQMAWENRPVAIYHTHSDESYVPSDGTESIPFRGGILQVGDSYKSGLNQSGAEVLHDKTPHDPHDDNAYYRSRRTAAQLMKKNPVALFDVHRDGIDDPEFYRRYISNENVAQMRFVIGRENPRMGANLDFAKRLMAYANKMHWPIAKEIFIAQGNYNQDLLPTAILIEAGTYTNKKEEAMRGISQLAQAVPIVLGITGVAPDPTGRGGWTALAWILVFTVVGGGAFLVISSGGWEQALEKLRGFFGKEFAGLPGALEKIGWRRRRPH